MLVVVAYDMNKSFDGLNHPAICFQHNRESVALFIEILNGSTKYLVYARQYRTQVACDIQVHNLLKLPESVLKLLLDILECADWIEPAHLWIPRTHLCFHTEAIIQYNLIDLFQRQFKDEVQHSSCVQEVLHRWKDTISCVSTSGSSCIYYVKRGLAWDK